MTAPFAPKKVADTNGPASAPKLREVPSQAASSPASSGLDPLPIPNASDSNEGLLELARAAVSRSPQLALEWAQAQTDSELRERLLFAVVRAWGEKDPRSAVDWALRQ